VLSVLLTTSLSPKYSLQPVTCQEVVTIACNKLHIFQHISALPCK